MQEIAESDPLPDALRDLVDQVAARTGEVYDIGLNVYAGATGLLLGIGVDGPRSLTWMLGAGSGRKFMHAALTLTSPATRLQPPMRTPLSKTDAA